MQNNATNQQCNKCCTIFSKGFTIIELIIVVLIIAVVGGAVIGRMLNGIERTRLQAAGRQVVSHIRLAQERSKLEQRAFTVEFNATDETYAVYQAGGSFTASWQYVSGSAIVAQTALTLEAWIYPTSYPAERATIIMGTASYYLSLASDGSLQCYWYGTSPEGYHSSGASTVSLNAWSHVAAVWNGSNVNLYVNDGAAKNTVSVTGSGNSATALNIGAESSSRQFVGRISEVRIYNRALTTSEISYSYTYKKPQNRAGLVGWWKLDEGQGTSAADSSGNGYNGTITGATFTQGVLSYIKDPAKNYQDINYDFDNLPEFSGVKISTVDFDGTTVTNSSKISFDSLGRPRVGTESLSANGTVVLTAGSETLTITVNKSTGEVKMQ